MSESNNVVEALMAENVEQDDNTVATTGAAAFAKLFNGLVDDIKVTTRYTQWQTQMPDKSKC